MFLQETPDKVGATLVPKVERQRLTHLVSTNVIQKGLLNKFRSRLPVMTQSQESSRVLMSTVTTDKLQHGVVTGGPFQVGETITGGTSGATGTILYVNAVFVTYTPLTGTFQASELITGGTSGASATTFSVTTKNYVGQIVKITEDNIVNLRMTLASTPPEELLDYFEASQAVMQLMWTTAGIAILRDTVNYSQGASSGILDHSALTTYTHTVSFIKHNGVVGGPFQLNETLTGGTSGATATIGAIDVLEEEMRLVNVVGIFQAGETLTGSVSGASSVSTTARLTSENWSEFRSFHFDARFNGSLTKQRITFSITDGVNTATTAEFANTVLGAFETHIQNLADLAALGTPAAVDLTAITSYSFATAKQAGAGYVANVDNLHLVTEPGSVDFALYDLGATRPDASTIISAGTLKQLGDLGILGSQSASLTVPLDGSKQLVKVDHFAHGPAKELPTNTLLTPGNYYAVVLSYNDTDVEVYGANPSYGIQYYPNGFAFTTPALATAITPLGDYYDCMFILTSAVDVYIDRIALKAFPATSGQNRFICTVEDLLIRMRILAEGSLTGSDAENLDMLELPVHMPPGGKFEVYYTDDIESAVERIGWVVRYWHAQYDEYEAA